MQSPAGVSPGMRRFEGRVALVTGAGGAIGGAVADRCSAEGAKVLAVDVDTAAAEATAQRVCDAGATAEAWTADMSDEEAIQGAVDRALQLWGRLDVVVNNAARFDYADIFSVTRDQLDRSLAVNITGTTLMMKHALAAMQACGAKGASIINVGSVLSFCALPSFIPYAPTKAAIAHLTRCAAVDARDRGVRINAVCPGPIFTRATERHAAAQGKTVEETVEEMARRMATPRMGRPDEVAAAIAFLASDDASFINGECLMVDGGYSLF